MLSDNAKTYKTAGGEIKKLKKSVNTSPTDKFLAYGNWQRSQNYYQVEMVL